VWRREASTFSIAYNAFKPGVAAQGRRYHVAGLPVVGGSVLFISFQSVASLLTGLPLQLLLLLAGGDQNSLKHYFKTQFADQTFRGLYHWN